jgi:hypothetical protein
MTVKYSQSLYDELAIILTMKTVLLYDGDIIAPLDSDSVSISH